METGKRSITERMYALKTGTRCYVKIGWTKEGGWTQKGNDRIGHYFTRLRFLLHPHSALDDVNFQMESGQSAFRNPLHQSHFLNHLLRN